MNAKTELESLLQGFGGWGDLQAGQDPKVSQQDKEEMYRQALTIGAPFMTPAGRACLAMLKTMTTENVTWNPEGGLLAGVANGFHREGQNSMIRYIEAQMRIIEQGPPVTEDATDE